MFALSCPLGKVSLTAARDVVVTRGNGEIAQPHISMLKHSSVCRLFSSNLQRDMDHFITPSNQDYVSICHPLLLNSTCLTSSFTSTSIPIPSPSLPCLPEVQLQHPQTTPHSCFKTSIAVWCHSLRIKQAIALSPSIQKAEEAECFKQTSLSTHRPEQAESARQSLACFFITRQS